MIAFLTFANGIPAALLALPLVWLLAGLLLADRHHESVRYDVDRWVTSWHIVSDPGPGDPVVVSPVVDLADYRQRREAA